MRNDWRRTRWGACPFCGGPDYCGYDTLSDGSDAIYCRRIFGYTGRRTAGGAFVDLNPKDVVIGLDGERYVFVKRTGQDCAMFIAEDDYAAFIENSKEEFKRMHPTGKTSNTPKQYEGVVREEPKTMMQEPKKRTWRARKEDTETSYDRLTKEQREEQILIVDRVDKAYRTMLSKLILETSDQARLMKKDGWERNLLSYARDTFLIRSLPPEDFDRFNENSPRRLEYASLDNIYRKKLCAEMGCDLDCVPGFFRGKAGLPLMCGQPGMLFPVFDQKGRIYRLRLRVSDEERKEQAKREFDRLKEEEYERLLQIYHTDDEIRLALLKSCGKYKNFSSGWKENGGNGVIGTGIGYYGLDLVDDYRQGKKKRVFVCEGEKKGMVGNYFLKEMFLTLPGVGMYHNLNESDFGLPSAYEYLKSLGVTEIVVANDADMATNANVRKATVGLLQEVKQHGFTPVLARWDEAAGKGIDDCLIAGVMPKFYRVDPDK